MNNKKFSSKQLFLFNLILLYLPNTFLISNLTSRSQQDTGILLAFVLHVTAFFVFIYENYDNKIFKKVLPKLAIAQAVLVSFLIVSILVFISIVLYGSFVLFKDLGIVTSLIISSPPLAFLYISHLLREKEEKTSPLDNSINLSNSSNEAAEITGNSKSVEKPIKLANKQNTDENNPQSSRKHYAIAVTAVCVLWIGFAHTQLAYDRALQEANYISVGSAWENVNSVSRASQNGYFNYCTAVENEKIVAVISKLKKDLSNNYREKEQSVAGLSFLNSLLNQSFGDRAYENYKNKYGTSPFDALTALGLLYQHL